MKVITEKRLNSKDLFLKTKNQKFKYEKSTRRSS